MALLSALYHEGQAKQKASEELRKSKYGGDQTADTLIDLCEPSIPGVLMKKIVRGGNGEIPPVGVNVSASGHVLVTYFGSVVRSNYEDAVKVLVCVNNFDML